MMELNDNEFDAAFRKRVFDADPQFEEAAWNKMEQKLRRRDRVVFFRKVGSVCLLLLIGFFGYLIIKPEPAKNIKGSVVKNRPAKPGPIGKAEGATTVKINRTPLIDSFAIAHTGPGTGKTNFLRGTVLGVKLGIDSAIRTVIQKKTNGIAQDSINHIVPYTILAQVTPEQGGHKMDSATAASSGSDVLPASVASVVKKRKSLRGRALPMSLSLSVGPEFNSSSSLVGGKKGFSAGLGFSVGITKRISLQTGLRYSAKDYAADSYAYQFSNPKVKDLISKVDASCAVLEIPLQASYTFWEDAKKSIDVNVGVSSYLMLKEDYTYRYTTGSGIEDRFQEYRNKNQHYFGVADLSATYYIKLRKEKLRLGLEPYIKIPLTGVGEGRVNLKSSGLSLKLRYDLGK